MRLRSVPAGYEELVKNHPLCIHDPKQYRGKWSNYFKNSNPIHIEVGSGKGKFITTLAKENKTINYIAMEKFTTVVAKLLKKVPEKGLENLAVLNTDAEQMPEFFVPGELSRIYLNFSDPWPKKRHAKRRLTHIRFLEIFKPLLKDDGFIAFKTDNIGLFNFSIEQFELAGFLLENITFDLHHSSLQKENITTEYEERFISQGLPIYGLTAYKNNITVHPI